MKQRIESQRDPILFMLLLLADYLASSKLQLSTSQSIRYGAKAGRQDTLHL